MWVWLRQVQPSTASRVVRPVLSTLEELFTKSSEKFFKDLSKIFYMLMVLVFLLGITFNVSYYVLGAWWTPTFTTSIAFFAGFQLVGLSNLGAILLIILYIYAMSKIVKKFE